MATEFNYVARLDTSQIMSGLSEIRSQVGMALGGALGFGGGGLSNVGGATSGLGQMMSGLGGGIQGGTFTDPAMAYTPHYGTQSIQTTLAQENLISGPGGMAAAGRLAPPGMSPGDFALGAAQTNIERNIQAADAANTAGQSALMSGIGGEAAGVAGWAVGTRLGGVVGAGLGSKFLGSAGAGRGIGKLAGGLALAGAAYSWASDKISGHYADAEQERGINAELGDIFGGGQNLSKSQMVDVGIAAGRAAKSLKMDPNEMADIGMLARRDGLLPGAGSGNLEGAIRDLASTMRDTASKISGSTSDASSTLAMAAAKGLTMEQAIQQSNGGVIGASAANSLNSMMGSMGASYARSMGFAGQQGSELFTNALGQASGAGMSGEEMRILGGRTGVASMIGATQLQMASSPIGRMQMMAAQGGEALGGLMDLPGQAMAAMGNGDMMSNMVNFSVHEGQFKRGIGSKGVRAMTMNQLESFADLYGDLAPESSRKDLMAFGMMKMYGKTDDEARAFVGGVSGGRGGGAGVDPYNVALKNAQDAEARQAAELGARMSAIPATEQRASFGLGYAVDGALYGATLGPKGAAVGAVGGFLVGNAKALWQTGGDILDGIGNIGESSTERAERSARAAAAEYERTDAGVKNRMGMVEYSAETAARYQVADMSGVRMEVTAAAMGPRAMAMTESALRLGGLTPVAAGPGTTRMDNQYWSTAGIQRLAGNWAKEKPMTAQRRDEIAATAYDLEHSFAGPSIVEKLRANAAAMGPKADVQSEEYRKNLLEVSGNMKALVDGIRDPKERKAMQEAVEKYGIGAEGSAQRELLKQIGVDFGGNPMDRATAMLGSAGRVKDEERRSRQVDWIAKAFGKEGGDLTDLRSQAGAFIDSRQYTDFREARSKIKPGKARDEYDDRHLGVAIKSFEKEHGYKDQNRNAPGDGSFDTSKAVDAQRQFVHEPPKKFSMYTDGRDPVSFTADLMGIKLADEKTSSFSENADAADKAPGSPEARKRRRGPGVTSRAVGFGEQESAMSAINKSLERTAKMIDALYKKESGKKP